MKKKNLKLKDLKVESFVTNDSNSPVRTIKGGYKLPYTGWNLCSFNCPIDPSVTQCGTANLCETMVADQCMD